MSTSKILGSYSPENVTVVINHSDFSHIIGGFVEGAFVSVSRENPHATLYTGADLSNARVIRRNKGGTISVSLHQASESNDVLSYLLQKDEENADGTWLFGMTIKDELGRSVFHSPVCFISNPPEASFGTDLGDRTWVIQAVSIDQVQGGNGKLSPDTVATLTELGFAPEDRWKATP
jgi:Protein of unknown function (DUF3277)